MSVLTTSTSLLPTPKSDSQQPTKFTLDVTKEQLSTKQLSMQQVSTPQGPTQQQLPKQHSTTESVIAHQVPLQQVSLLEQCPSCITAIAVCEQAQCKTKETEVSTEK